VPELPEVETVRRGLQDHTQGLLIAQVDVLRARAIASPPDPELFVLGLRDCRLGQWQRRGKYLFVDLRDGEGGDGGHWGVHLRMTGQFLWFQEPPSPCPHTRVRLFSDAGAELRFVDTRSFGQMWWIPPGVAVEEGISGLRRLGPEPFGPDFTTEWLTNRLRGSKRPIKTALLDQTLVAGVGNIYADESLFAAGLDPHTPSGRLTVSQIEQLRGALVEVLRISIGAGGTTFSDFRDLRGLNGHYGGQAWVYRRHGQPCRRCGAPIRREQLSGRGCHWCPSCQR
jgi:formamidopyrimidine-DNA glycosylase